MNSTISQTRTLARAYRRRKQDYYFVRQLVGITGGTDVPNERFRSYKTPRRRRFSRTNCVGRTDGRPAADELSAGRRSARGANVGLRLFFCVPIVGDRMRENQTNPSDYDELPSTVPAGETPLNTSDCVRTAVLVGYRPSLPVQHFAHRIFVLITRHFRLLGLSENRSETNTICQPRNFPSRYREIAENVCTLKKKLRTSTTT